MLSLRAGSLGLATLVLGLALAGCDRDRDREVDRRGPGATTTIAPADDPPEGPADQAVPVDVPADRPRGGTARVAVWAPPDADAPMLGGAAVRSLTLPQLFVARPDGRWSPSLVEPRSDVTGAGAASATFRLRSGATWSDGAPITSEDLRRSADPRFVASVDDGAAGVVTVRFHSPLPGWRRLWSADAAVSPPVPGVWGGPFVVADATPGLETRLTRNDRWWGPGPFLDEVRLVLVPDPSTARQLLARGDVDVVMPPAATVREPQLSALPGVKTDRVAQGGWSVVLLANPLRLRTEQRRALLSSFDRGPFVSTLLAGEAAAAPALTAAAEGPWVGVAAGDAGALGSEAVDLIGNLEEPMLGLVHRSMQKRVRAATDAKATIELRAAEIDRVEAWAAEGSYQAAVLPWLDPLGGCWICRWPDLGEAATAADAGDPAAVAAIQQRLRDEARVLPLWRPATVVAWRDSLRGVAANGYAASGAWNAWEWWRPAP